MQKLKKKGKKFEAMGGTLTVPDEIKNMETDTSLCFDVKISYCGSWGYYQYFQFAQDCINTAYPAAKISGYEIPGASGNFDVKVSFKGQSTDVFSKNKGDGRLNQEKSVKMVEKIKQFVQKGK